MPLGHCPKYWDTNCFRLKQKFKSWQAYGQIVNTKDQCQL